MTIDLDDGYAGVTAVPGIMVVFRAMIAFEVMTVFG